MAAKSKIWMPFYWADYLADTVHLSTEEHGAYMLLIGAYWQAGGPLVDDDARLARITRLPLRRWKIVRETLAEFFTIADQKWHLKRADEELSASKKRHLNRVEGRKKRQGLEGKNQQNQSRKAVKSASSQPENSPYVCARTIALHSHSHDSDKSESDSPHSPPAVVDGPPPDDVAQAVADWNALADEVGLARVQLVSDKRKAAVRRRLAEAGGGDGWRAALEKIRGSPGLRGENNKGWRVSFDWLVTQSNFTKIMEGNYDDWNKNHNQPHSFHGGASGVHRTQGQRKEAFLAAMASLAH